MLTDAGNLLVSHGDAAICRLEQAERELAELTGLGSGELRMVSFSSASATIVAAAAKRFAGLHPEVRLSLAEAEPEDSLAQLQAGQFDIALAFDFELYPFEGDRDLDHDPPARRAHARRAPARPPARRPPIAPARGARRRPVALRQQRDVCRQLTLRSCEQAGFTPDVAYESNDYTVMLALVAAGMGVTLVPDLALLIPSPDVPILEIEPEAPMRRVWARTLEAGARSSATDAMVDVLREVSADIIPRCDAAIARLISRACSIPSAPPRRPAATTRARGRAPRASSRRRGGALQVVPHRHVLVEGGADRAEGADVLGQPVADPLALGLVGAEHAVPDDQDAAVVLVEVDLVGAVVDAVVRGRVEDPLERPRAAA